MSTRYRSHAGAASGIIFPAEPLVPSRRTRPALTPRPPLAGVEEAPTTADRETGLTTVVNPVSAAPPAPHLCSDHRGQNSAQDPAPPRPPLVHPGADDTTPTRRRHRGSGGAPPPLAALPTAEGSPLRPSERMRLALEELARAEGLTLPPRPRVATGLPGERLLELALLMGAHLCGGGDADPDLVQAVAASLLGSLAAAELQDGGAR